MLLRKPLFSLGLAVVLGLLAAVFAARWIQGRAKAVEADLRDSRPVLVAAKTIESGASLHAEDLKLVAWPRNSVPEGTLDSVAAAAGKYSAQKLLPGEVVFRQRLLDRAGNSLSTQIEPNKRALTVRVNDVIGVAGFLTPGCRVDVLATRLDNERRASTRTLLQDIKVLAVDQTAQVEKDEPVVVRAVTLEMGPAEAEQLVGATEEGTVQLALRNPGEQKQPAAEAAAPAPLPTPVRSARIGAPAGHGRKAQAEQSVQVIRLTQRLDTKVHP